MVLQDEGHGRGSLRAVVEQGLIPVVPENQRTIYLNWMANIRDWCISRQLWWGHRIPIWYCADCQAMTPARDSRVEVVNGHAAGASPPEKCAACGRARSSSRITTCSIPGSAPACGLFRRWAGRTTPQDLRDFYPTSVLISGYDILFFWDARMIMMGLHLMKDRRARDQRSRALSLAVSARAGARSRRREDVQDARQRGGPARADRETRHRRAALHADGMAAPGTDIALSEDRILSYRAFANKIWNAARFIFVNLEKFQASQRLSDRGTRRARDSRRPRPTPTAGQHRPGRPLDLLAPRAKPWPRSTTPSNIFVSTRPRTSSITFSGATSATGTSSG